MRVPRLHVICRDEELSGSDALRRCVSVLEAGGNSVALHLRPRELETRRCLALATELVPLATAAGGWLVVNGRTDVARVARAHAVQLGAGALGVEAARRVLHPECAIGVSTHSVEDCRAATKLGADFLLLGTIYETASHPGRAGAGPRLIERCMAVDAAPPIVAIGGIDVRTVEPVIEAGAHGVAVIRAVWQSEEPAAATVSLVRALERTSQAAHGGRSMNIKVNGRAHEFMSGATVLDLLQELGLDPRIVVVERNREIIRRDDLEAVRVEEGDSYEIVQFVGGG